MRPLHRRLSAFVSIAAAAAFTAGCGVGPFSDSDDGAAAEESAPVEGTPDPENGELEVVENFYGEYADYVTASVAVDNGDTTVEELEHPWVLQQDHVDAAEDWDGENPAYEMTPPAGGNHLSEWQTCTGSVYDAPLIDGHAVHSMEHGAVWLTYDPELVDEAQAAELAQKIEGRDYSLMSPYPGQGAAVSLQSWGNQYQTDDVTDPTIDAYLDTYVLNEQFNPEVNATCAGGVTATAQ